MYLYEYTLLTEMAIHKFIDENELSVEKQQQLHKQIEENLKDKYFVPDYIHTVLDLLCKAVAEEETKGLIVKVVKTILLKGKQERYFKGYLDSVNKEQLVYAMMDFLEQNGYLEDFINLVKDMFVVKE